MLQASGAWVLGLIACISLGMSACSGTQASFPPVLLGESPGVGLVLFKCTPAPCRVLLNERPIRELTDEPESFGLPAGFYRVTFERDGYLSQHAELEVEVGRETSLVVELWPRWRALGE